jgi:hypothetical protein
MRSRGDEEQRGEKKGERKEGREKRGENFHNLPLSSILYPLSSILYPLSSFLFPHPLCVSLCLCGLNYLFFPQIYLL